ncbi:MAG TPA: hypothetical protein VID04_11980 [Methylomirabilota bacterium]
MVYSHHHYDHIAGGKPFKDAGATVLAHRRAAERLARLKDPHTVLPDETMDGQHEAGCAESIDVPAGRLGRREGSRPGRQVLGDGREGGQASQVRSLAGLRTKPAVRPAALLRALGSRHLSRGSVLTA